LICAENWIYQSDSWQYAIRWEQIIAMRDKTDFVEQVTWNGACRPKRTWSRHLLGSADLPSSSLDRPTDYGESHYIGPIAGDQPNSEAWVNGFDHSAFLAVNKYYSAAFKTGKYPTISCDVVYLMARPHDNRAVGTNDPAGPPTLGQYGAPGSQYAETKCGPSTEFGPLFRKLTLRLPPSSPDLQRLFRPHLLDRAGDGDDDVWLIYQDIHGPRRHIAA
jgi:hypothetical protein